MNREQGGSRIARRLLLAGLCGLCLVGTASAQSAPAVPTAVPPTGISAPTRAADGLYLPDVSKIIPAADNPEGVSASLQVLVLLTVLTLVPSILIMMTAFPRVVIVLTLLRQAMGTPQLPPGQVLLGLSLFVTFIVMAPTWHRIHANVVTPYFDNQMGHEEALDRAGGYLKEFMYQQIDQAENYEDIYLFMEYAEQREIPAEEALAVEQVPMTVMVPAFMLSELKTAFVMGFKIYLPFLVIDMVIATILISMGMLMLPPVLVSLPFKILLFVLADGWHLVVETLLFSFG